MMTKQNKTKQQNNNNMLRPRPASDITMPLLQLPVPAISNICCVCMMDLSPNRKKGGGATCEHYGCPSCIDSWLLMNYECPVCGEQPDEKTIVVYSITRARLSRAIKELNGVVIRIRIRELASVLLRDMENQNQNQNHCRYIAGRRFCDRIKRQLLKFGMITEPFI